MGRNRSGRGLLSEEREVTRLTTADGLSDDRAPAIGKDREGNIWIATYSGLDRFRNGRIESVRHGKDVPFTSATTLFEDRDRNLWIGTENGGLYRYSRGVFSHLGTEDGLPDANISTLFEDREGSLWVGTMNGGAAQLRPGAFTTISTEEGLQDKTAWTTLAARDGTIWVGTTKGIAMIRDGRVTTLTMKDGLPSNLVWSLYEDRAGVIWIGTTAGLVRYEKGELRVFTTADGLPNNAIRSITEDHAGNLWLATSGTDNVVRFHDGVFTSYNSQLGFDGGVVGELAEDYEGGMWMATTRNVIEMKHGTYTRYAFRFSTVAIHHDRDGGHWFGTWGGGLRRIKNGRVTAITTKDGLFDDVAYAIVDDGLGYFWMTCNHGVYRTSKQELNDFADHRIRRVHSLAFGTGDGIKNSDCNRGGTPSASQGPDGRIWGAHERRSRLRRPSSPLAQRRGPLRSNRRGPDRQQAGEHVDRRLTVPAGRHNLEIHYTALSFVDPAKVIFRYRLRGFDERWVEAGNRRVAYYTNIPPGSYAFEVMGCNNDGLWSGGSTPLTIRVLRAYYQTWWFYSLLALVVATLIISVHTYRVQSLRAEALIRTNAELVEARDDAENWAKMNEKLRRESALILDSVADGILRVDLDGRLTFLNPAATRMFGRDINAFQGGTVHDAIHPRGPNGEPGDSEHCPLARALRSGELLQISNDVLRRADGSSFAAEYSSTPMRDSEGNLQGTVIAVRDISERHAMERLKDEFVSTVSHELRTPLTSIRGALGLLSSGKLGTFAAKPQRMLQIAVINTDRLARLINDILDIERIDSGVIELNRTIVDAHELMAEAIDGVQAMADEAGVGLTLEPCVGELRVDSDRILQTLTNLLSNAIKFSPRGETVTLGGTAGGDGMFTVRLADRGRGIPDDKVDLIFERFKQVDASDSRDKGGSGLGLAICRSIVDAHGGRIWTEKNGEQGSVFLFTVPLNGPVPVIPEIEPSAALPRRSGHTATGSSRSPL